MKQRDLYVDVAKGLCMLLIICIHTEVFSVIGMRFTFIAVPMFFFMSGFYDRSEKPMMEWLPKTAYRLIRPAVIWIIIGGLFMRILSYVKTGMIEPYVFNWQNPQNGNGPVWFLIALLYAKIITSGTLEFLRYEDGCYHLLVYTYRLDKKNNIAYCTFRGEKQYKEDEASNLGGWGTSSEFKQFNKSNDPYFRYFSEDFLELSNEEKIKVLDKISKR